MWRTSYAYYEDAQGNYCDIFTDEVVVKAEKPNTNSNNKSEE